MGRLASIYALIDPVNGSVRYIGKTVSPRTRLCGHINDRRSKNIHKISWINSLKKKGLVPEMAILDEVPEDDWRFWEVHYVFLYRSWGFSLTNKSFGGDGPISVDRDKMASGAAKRKGKTFEEIYGKEKADSMKKRISFCRKNEKRDYSAFGKLGSDKRGTRLPEEIKVKMKANSANKGLLGGLHYGAKAISQHSRSGEFIKDWESFRDVERTLGIKVPNLSAVVSGREKTAGGFIWKLKNKSLD